MATTTISLRRRTGVFLIVVGMLAAMAPLTFAAPAWGASGGWSVDSLVLFGDDGSVIFEYSDTDDVTVPSDEIASAEVRNADLIVTSNGETTSLHVSCSDDLSTDPGTISLGGVDVNIADYSIRSTNPRGNSDKSCGRELPDPELTSLTIDKTQVDNRASGGNETFAFSVVCDEITYPRDGSPIKITGSDTYTLDGITADADCTVTEIDAAGATTTTGGTMPDPTSETTTVDITLDDGGQITATDGPVELPANNTVYFVNTFDGDDPDRRLLTLAKLWFDANGDPASDLSVEYEVNATLVGEDAPFISVNGDPTDSREGEVPTGDDYTVTETLVSGYSEVACDPLLEALGSDEDGSIAVEYADARKGTSALNGEAVFSLDDDSAYAEQGGVLKLTHIVCNQEDPDPVTPTPPDEPTEVEPAAIEPAASIISECTADEELEVSYALDNTRSEDGVTFGVDVSDQGASEIDVAAGDSTPGGFVVTPEQANVIVVIGAEGQKFVDTTLSAEDCVEPVEVLPDAEEAPDPEPVEGQDQAAEVVSEQASLPDTGVSSALLTLMGLLSMGLGGALLRPRKRD